MPPLNPVIIGSTPWTCPQPTLLPTHVDHSRVRVGGYGLGSTDVNFLQEIEKLKKTNAESKQVKILELRQQVASSKRVRKRSMSQ